MALTIKQLNGDASFLLTLEPTQATSLSGQYHILIDPWIAGPSSTLHPKFSSITHAQPACISSLRELPEPDLVLVSHSRSAHCHEATLRQLASHGSKTLILAVPAAASLIRSWNYFDKSKIKTLDPWKHPRKAGRHVCFRTHVLSPVPGGGDGEVTVAYIRHRKRHPRGHHSAIAITYRPPTPEPCVFWRQTATPPLTPNSAISARPPQLPAARRISKLNLPPPMSWKANSDSKSPCASPRNATSAPSLSSCARDRCVSIIFSPYGIPYSSLEPYVTSHLLTEAALPLTALLHCFQATASPWWPVIKGDSGVHTGQQIATALGARAWISTYDGSKIARGLASRLTKRSSKHDLRKLQFILRLAFDRTAKARLQGSVEKKKREDVIEILALEPGAQLTLTSEGLWDEQSSATTTPFLAKQET